MRAMHAQDAVPPECHDRPREDGLTRRLLSLYSRWLVWYVLGVLVLWVVGIEAMYRHPTPFHALYAPVLPSLWLLLGMAAGLGLAVTAGRAWLREDDGDHAGGIHGVRRRWAALCTGVLLVACVGLYLSAGREGRGLVEELAAQWERTRWHLPPVLVFGAFLLVWIHVLRRTSWFDREPDLRTARWILVGLIVFAALFSTSVAMIRDGTAGVTAAYERHTYEYINDIGRGMTIRGLFRDYNSLHPYLSMHSKVHPPGPVAILWVLSYVAATRGPLGLSIATILFGALGVIPLYLWARDLAGKRIALTCCVLYTLMPGIVLFTATSADILFMPFTLTTLFLFWRAIDRRSIRYAIAAGAMYAVLSLISFSLVGLGAFFGLVGLWRLTKPGARLAVVQTGVVMAVAFLAVHGLVWLWTGFDVFECFRLSKNQFDTDQLNLEIWTPRYPAWTWRILNPLCWVFFAGIPVSLLFVWRLARPDHETKGLFLVFVLTLLAFDVLYLARGEGERSAMYIYPFMALPAAHVLDRLGRESRMHGPMIATMCFLAFQCWLVESYLFTYW